MRFWVVFCLAAAVPLCSQVKFAPAGDSVNIEVDGTPFATFHSGVDANKPYIAPIRSASGKIVTRRYPMEKVEGESRDHPHHRGLWFSYDDVNGTKFWENDPSYKNPNIGKIRVAGTVYKHGKKSGKLTTDAEWADQNGKILLLEHRLTTVYSDPALRIMDFDITLTAPDKVVFGDTKEGAFAIRLADSMIEKRGGKMVNADGQSGMAQVWGHKSKWVDYSGDVDGEKLGVAILDHPSNPRFPTYWHARDYGLFALNPFGQKAFDKNLPESRWALEKGQSLRFRWRVIVHPGDAETARVSDLYRQFESGSR